jgi:hypothetical protein
MKNTLKFISLATLLAAKAAFAFLAPEDGWWWNPAQPGFGYNIETQNGTVFVALFIYDDNGGPVWYSGSSTINQNNSVAIDLKRSEGGPCLGCTYTSSQANSIGKQLVLTFDDSKIKGTATLDGITNNIERYNFTLGDKINKLLGAWIIAAVPSTGSGLGISHLAICTGITSTNATCQGGWANTQRNGTIFDNGNEIYSGRVPISATEDIVLRFKFFGLNGISGYSVIVDSSASNEEASQELSNNGQNTVGFRYLSLQELN